MIASSAVIIVFNQIIQIQLNGTPTDLFLLSSPTIHDFPSRAAVAVWFGGGGPSIYQNRTSIAVSVFWYLHRHVRVSPVTASSKLLYSSRVGMNSQIPL